MTSGGKLIVKIFKNSSETERLKNYDTSSIKIKVTIYLCIQWS